MTCQSFWLADVERDKRRTKGKKKREEGPKFAFNMFYKVMFETFESFKIIFEPEENNHCHCKFAIFF